MNPTVESIGVDDALAARMMLTMDAYEAARQFGDLFPAIFRRFHRRVHHSAYRPSMESVAILQHLAEGGPLTVTEAARHMDRSQAAMSELIQRLVDRDLLARMPDERDRRRVLIWLTEAGRTALSEARQVLDETLLHAAFKHLTPTQQADVLTAMQTLLDTPITKGPQHD